MFVLQFGFTAHGARRPISFAETTKRIVTNFEPFGWRPTKLQAQKAFVL
jgi:hypothetical protein